MSTFLIVDEDWGRISMSLDYYGSRTLRVEIDDPDLPGREEAVYGRVSRLCQGGEWSMVDEATVFCEGQAVQAVWVYQQHVHDRLALTR